GVRVEYVGRAPLEGSDDSQLIATLRTGVPAPAPSLVRVASARSFVPDTASYGRPIRGEIPIPEGRPFSLGNTPPESGSANATSEMPAFSRTRSAARALDNPGAFSYESDDHYAVSAYAPIDRPGPSEILSGRGLY